MRPLPWTHSMKPSLTHLTVVLTVLIASPALANDVVTAAQIAPENGNLHKQTSLNEQKLQEVRNILGKINTQLANPNTDANEDAAIAYADTPVTTEITTEETVIAKQPQDGLNAYKTLQVSYEGDVEMSCGALSSEAGNMRDIIYATQDIKNHAKMKKQGIKAAGAIGSFLIGSVTGGVGLAVGGFLLDQGVDNTRSNADIFQDTAEQRRTLMMGIYNAKGCNGPLEHAMQNPEVFDPIPNIEITTTAQRDDYDFNK